MAFSNHDIVSDSPTNNFCALNPLASNLGTVSLSISEGNLKATAINQDNRSILSTLAISSGKWYFETVITTNPGWHTIAVGFREVSQQLINRETDNSLSYGISINQAGAWNKLNSGSATSLSTSNYSSGATVIGMAFDADAGTLSISKDGVWENNIYVSIPSGTYQPFTTVYWNSGLWTTSTLNFGQDPTFGGLKSPTTTYTDANGIGAFYYQPPTDALALCTANLPEMTPDVTGDVPADYFKCLTYSGTFSQQDIAVGFKPDLVWAKSRTQTYGHMLYDTVRGQAHLNSDTADAEVSDTQLAFHSTDGFTVSAPSGELNDTTGAPNNYIAWCWKAGGAPTTDNTATSGAMNANGSAATSSNSSVSLNGTLQSNYTPAGSPTIYPKRMSINTDAGFSIVSWSGNNTAGATYPHGLSKAPEFIITKATNASVQWIAYSSTINSTAYLSLTDEFQTARNSWFINNTPPSTSLISSGYQFGTQNDSAQNYITYCWHSVEGYSKFGFYTGNGSADGPFVYCGFRPAWVMVKRTVTDGYGWYIWDTAREPHNYMYNFLASNAITNEANNTYYKIDFLSNGFKLRNDDGIMNASTNYIFMAFAEQPFIYSNAR